MERTNATKMKLVKLLELLRTQTDENHPMSTSEILQNLADMGMDCERRTLYRDMQVLEDYGYEVMHTRVGREKAHYIADRGFSLPEIKLLMDSVVAATFLTEKKTQTLVKKLSNLGGVHQASLLIDSLTHFNKAKHRNESIYYSIDQIQNALQEKRVISCFYFDLNENHEKVYRKEKRRYILEPYALVIRMGNYYLLTYSPKYQDTATYRVDRMEDVRMEEDHVCSQTIARQEHVSDHLQEAFQMFSGVPQWVELGFDPSLCGVIYDFFGEDTQVERREDGLLSAKVEVQVAPTFWGWIFQFGGKMRILYPQSLVLEFHKHLAPFLPPAAWQELERSDDRLQRGVFCPEEEGQDREEGMESEEGQASEEDKKSEETGAGEQEKKAEEDGAFRP